MLDVVCYCLIIVVEIIFLGKEEWEKEKKWWVLNMEREKLIIRLNEKFFEKL